MAQLESLLADCWDEFEGSREEGMASYKLLNRMKEVEWNPPLLTFIIERHGALVMGSTRAEKYEWALNMETKTADYAQVGHRQVHKMGPAPMCCANHN